jgi:3-oxoadipate enol-lactonase
MSADRSAADLPRTWHGDAGASRTLVLLNSMGTVQAMWDEQIAALGRDHRILTLDLRGHVAGFTDAFGFEDFVTDTVRVLDQEDVRGATLVGVSLGGALALAVAAARPEMAGRLVLVNTPIRQSSKQFWADRADVVERDGLADIAAGMAGRWFPPDAGAPAQAVIDDFLALPVAGYAAACRALADLDVTDQADTVRLPTLVVSARDDAAVDPANSDELARRLPAATLWPVASGGHLLPVGRPEVLHQVISAYESAQPAGEVGA